MNIAANQLLLVVFPYLAMFVFFLGTIMRYRKAPFTWLLMLMMMAFFLVLLASFPVVGPVVAITLIPGLNAGLMVVASLVERGLPVLPIALIAPLRARPRAHLFLGLVYVTSLAALLSLTTFIDDGAVWRNLTDPRARPTDMGALERGLWVMRIGLIPLTAAFWFSPALVHDAHMTPSKALFYSFFATVRNLRAFLVYGAACLAIMLCINYGLLLVASLFSQEPQRLAQGAQVGAMFIFLAVLVATFYVSYVTVFGKPPAEAPTPPPANLPLG